jgi:hypothetical protein
MYLCRRGDDAAHVKFCNKYTTIRMNERIHDFFFLLLLLKGKRRARDVVLVIALRRAPSLYVVVDGLYV